MVVREKRRSRSLNRTPRKGGLIFDQENDDDAEKRAHREIRRRRSSFTPLTPTSANKLYNRSRTPHHGSRTPHRPGSRTPHRPGSRTPQRRGPNTPRNRIIGTPRLLGWSNRRTPIQKPSLTQMALTDMYQKVLKKVSKNSFNKKNAWDIPICTYVQDLIRMDKKNFPRSGTIVNAASVVLAAQVDDVHDGGHRIWQSLAGHKELFNEQDKAEALKKNRKRYKRSLNAVESAVTLTVEDFACGRSVLFNKYASMVDSGGCQNIMLANLKTQNQGTIIFDETASIEMLKAKPKEAQEQVLPPELFNLIPKPQPIDSRAQLCALASDCNSIIHQYERQTEHIKAGIEIDEFDDITESALQQKIDFNDDENPLVEINELNFEDEIPLDVNDDMFGLPEVIDDGVIDVQEEEQIWDDLMEYADEAFKRKEDLTIEDKANITITDDFDSLTSFFSTNGVWAGGSSLRGSRIRALRMRENEDGAFAIPRPKKRRKLNVDYIQYTGHRQVQSDSDKLVPLIDDSITDPIVRRKIIKKQILQQVDETKFQKAKPQQICIAKRTLQKWNQNYYSLPEDYNYNVNFFFTSTLNPNKILCPQNGRAMKRNPEFGRDAEGHFNMDNEFDDNFQNDFVFDDIDDAELPPNDEEAMADPLDGLMNVDLYELERNTAEKQKNKLEIPFSKKATNINVSQMKKCIFKMINIKGTTIENNLKMINFETLVEEVMFDSPMNVAEQLTVHIFYVCLLYCCNEYSLRLDNNVQKQTGAFNVYTTEATPPYQG